MMGNGRSHPRIEVFPEYTSGMPYALTLGLDPNASQRVRSIWQLLADPTGDEGVLQQGYAPHITLAVLSDSIQGDLVMDRIDGTVASWECLPIVLAGIGIFPGPSPVVWAAPVVTERLVALHRTLHALLGQSNVHPHYLPGAWMPHVTLSQPTSISLVRVVKEALSAWRGPIEGEANRVEFVQFHPVKLLRSRRLRPPS
jgi:2'-5' RNA ligase